MSSQLRIKICGVTSAADARQAALLGADAVGLNFFAQSPRYVAPAAVESILRELPLFVDAVGVFVNERLHEACELAGRFGRIHTIQWHAEDREPDDPFPFRLIAAFPVADQQSLLAITRYLDQCRDVGHLPAAVLVDAQVPGRYGGTGQTAPWSLLADFRPPLPVILAGGLTPDNVAEAVRIVRPYGVDVASGVEISPGHKDPERMRRFIGNAREAANR